jgi:hypothetical protein
MRIVVLALALALSACASPATVTSATLAAADAATSLIVGPHVTQEISTAPASEGMDPVVTLTLRHSDGRALSFQQANHTANDLIAQAPGGALAQVMGLFGEEAPTLYYRVGEGAPFLCAPEGPAGLGVYEDAEGVTHMVGLKQAIQFETRPDGRVEALPYSPDQVCARLRFTAG